MHKKFLLFAIIVLAVSLCMVACGKKSAAPTDPVMPDLETAETTKPAGTTDPQGTEGTEQTGGVTEPTLDYGTDVGSGRAEGNENTKPDTTKPTEPAPKPTDPAPDNALNMDYRQYMAMSGHEQQLFFDKYFANDPLAFATWFQKIKQEYDDETPEIIATGPIDIGDYINP